MPASRNKDSSISNRAASHRAQPLRLIYESRTLVLEIKAGSEGSLPSDHRPDQQWPGHFMCICFDAPSIRHSDPTSLKKLPSAGREETFRKHSTPRSLWPPPLIHRKPPRPSPPRRRRHRRRLSRRSRLSPVVLKPSHLQRSLSEPVSFCRGFAFLFLPGRPDSTSPSRVAS